MRLNTEKELNKFWKYVIQQSRSNLTKKKKNASKELYNSLKYDVKVSKNSFETSFYSEDYGKFIDKGVKGVGGTKANGQQWKKKKVTNNLYKYTNKKPPASAFNGWVIKRGLAGRNAKGQFTSRKSLMFAVANSVYHTGLETTNFFTKPFEKAFERLPEQIIEAYALDLDKLLNNSLK